MMMKKKQKKRYLIFQGGKESELSEYIPISNLINENKQTKEKVLRNQKEENKESRIVEFKTQGSLLSIQNNFNDNSKVSVSEISSSSSSCYSSSSNNESDSDDSFSVEESKNVCFREIPIEKKKNGQERKCFSTNFSENSSFYVESSLSDFENDSLFNNSDDFDDLDYMKENRENIELTNVIKGVGKKRKNTLDFLIKNSIQLFSLNAYLYNDVFRYNPHLYGIYEQCRSGEKRCEHIGNLCASFDLIFLRSVYGKYQLAFYEKLKNTHTILLDNYPLSNVNCITEFFYTFQNYIGGNGGLLACWRKRDFVLSFYDYIYLTSDILIKRKVIKLIKLKYKERYNLYFIHTEFDLFSTSNKLSNLDDLIMLIKKTLWKIYVLRIFYKNRKFLKCKKEKKGNIEEMDRSNLISEINNIQKKRDSYLRNSFEDEKNYEGSETNKKEKETYTKLLFKKTSMFVIGSFNIDRKEMKQLYEQLVTLNNQGVLKDLFFYKNIHFKLQNRYSIVDRENTLVGGLNYCFGLTDNIFLLENFTFHKESIEEMIYIFHPIDIVKEHLQLLKQSDTNYMLENMLPLINRNCISLHFQNVFNFGVDILTQKKDNEFSDHWAVSAQFLVKSFNKKNNIHIERHLHNFFRNVHKYFVIKKNRYSSLCEVNSIIEKKKKNKKKKKKQKDEEHDYLNIHKYDYSKRCIITENNLYTFQKMDKELLKAMERCFEF